MRLVFKTLDVNESLKTLSLVRMKLDDEDIEDLIENLSVNSHMEKIELDENILNSFSMLKFAESIKENKTLKHISFENNDLSRKDDYDGLSDFLEALKENTGLNYINLAYCKISNEHLDKIIELLKVNKNIIMLDVTGNFRLNYKKLREIQNLLVRNREEFDQEKRFEWEERKEMNRQHEQLSEINEIKKNNQDLLLDIKNKEEEKQFWRQKLIEEQLEKQKVDDYRSAKKLEKEMMIRALKKKKKGKAK